MSKVSIQGDPSGSGTFTIAAPNSNNNRTLTLPDSSGTVIVGTQPAGDIVGTTATQTLTNKSISADQINSGTLATARLGSGTANNTTFLRGDNTWQTISTTPTTDQVLTATAGASVGAVGTYGLFNDLSLQSTGGQRNPGTTRAGSDLRYSSAEGNNSGTSPSGTWRIMGFAIFTGSSNAVQTSVWLRIS